MGQHRTHTRRKSSSRGQTLVKEESELRLPPEDDTGNVEYKSKLIEPSAHRFQHLVTQMKWRLHEGQGEAVYEIGVEDDGNMSGLEAKEMSDSMQTLYRMASSVGASLLILNDRCVFGKPNDLNCRRVVEVLVRKLPEDQQFTDIRVAVLGSAAAGKSTLCGVLTQGVLDNGNGKCRLNLLRYMHEIRTGKTSSVNLDVFGFSADGKVLNYKECSLETILEKAAKLITLIDLAGDRKYLKTTIYGLSGYTPHYCALLLNGRVGWTGMSEEHWSIANAFNIPIFIVLTKADLVGEQRVLKIVHQVQAALNRNGKGMVAKRISSAEDVITASTQMLAKEVVPVFCVSNVTGMNLDLLTSFLNFLPKLEPTPPSRQKPLFYIDEVFQLPDTGVVVCGLVAEGVFREGDSIQLGPDSAGHYRLGKIKSLRRNKQPVLLVQTGDTASLAINFFQPSDICLKRGMVILSAEDVGVCCRQFVANFNLLSHPVGELCIGFQGTAYIGSLRRTVTIVDFGSASLHKGDETEVTFEFYGGPEFVRVGSKIFFRERDTKGTGEIVRIPDQ